MQRKAEEQWCSVQAAADPGRERMSLARWECPAGPRRGPPPDYGLFAVEGERVDLI